jgi:thiamine-monophosphate kinase
MAAGEFDLIERLRELLPPPTGERVRLGSGDDAAVVEPSGAATAITVDTLVEGVHFTLPEFPLRAVGRKALAAALSDLAAMGAEPREAYVNLGLPETLADDEVLELGEGLAETARREGVAVLGGDLTRAPALFLALSCVGAEPEGGRLISRAGARPGDAVAVTGKLGGAAAALALLDGDAQIEGPARDALLARQFDPRPRLEAGRLLAAAGATAMIDVSDGLGGDAAHVAEASGARIEIEIERLPLDPGAVALVGEERARMLAAGGGEDFELLVTLPPDRLDEAREALQPGGYELTEIGSVADGSGAVVRDHEGREIQVRGFDHMRGSRAGSS